MNANYTTTHVFVDKLNNPASRKFTCVPTPNEANVTAAELFTNLNQRDRAGLDADGEGIHDGILPPDGSLITPAIRAGIGIPPAAGGIMPWSFPRSPPGTCGFMN